MGIENPSLTNEWKCLGHLPELIDIIVAEKAKLFICAVGVPPQWAVDKLHAGPRGVVIANMVGSVRNTLKALDAGVDIIIAQGTEGGGIYDGRGLAASLSLGAAGVWVPWRNGEERRGEEERRRGGEEERRGEERRRGEEEKKEIKIRKS
eukprot:Skav222736  [mRNA]  locus=scaffold2390:341445:343099:+ [translate_table: standard]